MLALKNQFIFAPIKTGYSDGSGVITEKHLAYYEKRSRYMGAIIPEPIYVIGDAKKIGNAQHAIRDGYETAKAL
ncbi:MAG: hypothetical protein GQ545_03865 [Candidatus Aminicenantes bacterium]|nr:hypothetical protein [Candidatus Aminicenantes bacterium]